MANPYATMYYKCICGENVRQIIHALSSKNSFAGISTENKENYFFLSVVLQIHIFKHPRISRGGKQL